ncbi:hypothetical protein [[Clostridium] colinum]|uniref:hypothetical protein n=1 Tax=[Clostridium] colinum TaxID=36835 RepID=UPI002024B818|nr:hypothetical protein [[Clostridium] colinum]
MKFVSSDGIFEAVYDNEGRLLNRNNDPINMRTYNYAFPNEQLGIYHVIYDVIPYEQDMLENYIDKFLEEYFNISINTQFGNGLGNIGENILPPVSLNDETIEQVKEYRKGLGLE